MKKNKIILTAIILFLMLLALIIILITSLNNNLGYKEYQSISMGLSFVYPNDWSVKNTFNCNPNVNTNLECIEIIKEGNSIKIFSGESIVSGDTIAGLLNKSEIETSKIFYKGEYKIIRSSSLNMNGIGEFSSGIGLYFSKEDLNKDLVRYSQVATLGNGRQLGIGYFLNSYDANIIKEMDQVIENLQINNI